MCHYDYSGWVEKKKDMTMEWVLKTLGHIFDEADKDGLNEDETCQIKDCWTILAMLQGLSSKEEEKNPENGQGSNSGNGSAEEIASRVNGSILK